MKPWKLSLCALCLALAAILMSVAGRPAAPVQLETKRAIPAAGSAPLLTLDAAAKAAAEMPRLHSLLVSRKGELLLERYSKGIQPTQLANIKSVSKSVVSALVGIAVDRSLIPSTQQKVESYFPEILKAEKDPAKKNITIENLLAMQAGLETTSNRNYGAWVLSSNWVRHVLSRPLLNPPGSRMEYSTGNTHLLSAILTKATGKNTWQFAQDVLARPLGFSLARWSQDPQGIYFGGNDMLMTPRQLLKFGELYLNHGRAGGAQIVPSAWVDASFTARAESPREEGRHYGYGWWIRDLAGYRANYAWGYGGQFVFVVPQLDLVVVTTSASEVSEERRGHQRSIYDLVENFIIPSVAAAAD